MAFFAIASDKMAGSHHPQVADAVTLAIAAYPSKHMARIYHVLASHELGGAGQIGLHLVHDLKARGQTCQVWIPGGGAAKRAAETLGLDVHTYDAAGFFASSRLKAVTANFHLWHELHVFPPDLMHFHSPFIYRAMLPTLKLLGITSIVHIHLDEDEAGLQWALKHPPQLIVTCARFFEPYIRRTLSRRHQGTQRVVSVPNPVDTQKFYPGDRYAAKQRVGAPPNVPLTVMLANLAPHKGQEVAMRAIAALKADGIRTLLWLAGTERGGRKDYTNRLCALCGELDIQHQVRFLGHRDDAPDLLRAADLFLLPSTREGMPLSILEAHATKVPVLAAPTTGIPEIITDGETGFLIPPPDPLGYAARMKLLLTSPDLARRVSDRAYSIIVKEHSTAVYFQRIWSLYHHLIKMNSIPL
jgi:glycosyltransferase involved in cell wall biosynthesis